MSEQARTSPWPGAPAPRRIGLAELLRPVSLPSPEERAAAREAAAFRQGRAEAEAEAALRLAAADAARLALLAEAEAAQANAAATFAALQVALDAAFADSLARLALAIARAILAAEPAVSPASVHALATDLLAAAPPDGSAILRAEPATLAAAAPLLPPGWAARPDASLPPATLIAELDAMQLATSLEMRLAQLAAQLLEDCA
jgi:flagellar assembly protein FliH